MEADFHEDNEIKESLGDFLRRHREASGKTLEGIARNTRISKRYLLAFEENDSSNMPEEAFSRGFLKAYAVEVGLDTEDCILRYERFRRSLIPTQIREVKKTIPMAEMGEPMKSPKWIGVVLSSAVVLMLIIVIAIFALRSQNGVEETKRQEAAAAAAAAVQEDNGTPTPTADANGAPANEASAGQNSSSTNTSVNSSGASNIPAMPTPVRPSILSIFANREGKLSIRLDENAIQEISLKQGESQTLNVFREVEIRSPDKSAFALQYNGKPLEVSGPVIKLFNRYLFNKK